MTQPKPPARGRKNPDLLAPQTGPAAGEPTPEDHQPNVDDAMAAQHAGEEEGEMVAQSLAYAGDILTVRATIPVLLPGDHKESYFGSTFTTRVQDDEDDQDTANRAVTVVRDTVFGAIGDMIDTLPQFQEEVNKRLGQQ